MNIGLTVDDRSPIPHPMNRLLGSKTGIVRTLQHYLPDRSDPRVYYTTAVEPDMARLTSVPEAGSLDAGGTGFAMRESRLRAIGEAAILAILGT